MTAAELVRFLRGLRAVRRFAPDPLPRHVIDDVLEVARWTGSANNRQPWEMVLVQDPATLRALAGDAPGLRHLASAPCAIVLVPNGRLTDFDEGRWTERVLLAAAAHGLGAGIARVPREHAATLASLLDVPADRTIRTAVTVGRPAGATAHLLGVERETEAVLAKVPLGRKPLTELLHVDRYGRRA